MGALIIFCGHKGTFTADIWRIGTVNVIHASGPVTMDTLDRSDRNFDAATHHMKDFPQAGFWKPALGIFVIPEKQVRAIPIRKRRR
jgi:hypothetical protein